MELLKDLRWGRIASLVAVVGLIAWFAVSTCGGGGGEDASAAPEATPTTEQTRSATTSTGSTSEKSATATPSPTPTVADLTNDFGSTAHVSGAAKGAAGVSHLTNVRVGSDRGFDTIVFEFDLERMPAYTIEYSDRLPQCPVPPPPTRTPGVGSSGPETSVTRVRGGETPAAPPPSAPTEPPTPTPTPVVMKGQAFLLVKFYPADASGVSRTSFTGGSSGLVEALQLCSGVSDTVIWVVSTVGRQPFRSYTVDTPYRLAIDIEHK